MCSLKSLTFRRGLILNHLSLAPRQMATETIEALLLGSAGGNWDELAFYMNIDEKKLITLFLAENICSASVKTALLADVIWIPPTIRDETIIQILAANPTLQARASILAAPDLRLRHDIYVCSKMNLEQLDDVRTTLEEHKVEVAAYLTKRQQLESISIKQRRRLVPTTSIDRTLYAKALGELSAKYLPAPDSSLATFITDGGMTVDEHKACIEIVFKQIKHLVIPPTIDNSDFLRITDIMPARMFMYELINSPVDWPKVVALCVRIISPTGSTNLYNHFTGALIDMRLLERLEPYHDIDYMVKGYDVAIAHYPVTNMKWIPVALEHVRTNWTILPAINGAYVPTNLLSICKTRFCLIPLNVNRGEHVLVIDNILNICERLGGLNAKLDECLTASVGTILPTYSYLPPVHLRYEVDKPLLPYVDAMYQYTRLINMNYDRIKVITNLSEGSDLITRLHKFVNFLNCISASAPIKALPLPVD